MGSSKIDPPLPPGFVLEKSDGEPPLPPGFVSMDARPQRRESTLKTMARGYGRLLRGRQDPKFKDVPTYRPTDKAGLDNDIYAKVSTTSDAAYGDILKAHLGDRLIKSEKDAHGYEVITYRGDDGTEQRGYINKPGLDFQDVDRFAGATLPYLATGGLVGAGARGFGVVTRATLQGLGGATTSAGQDVAATLGGSQQPLDIDRMKWAGFGGALGEAAALALTGIYRYAKGARGNVSDGGLSQSAAEAAKRVGLDPSDLSDKEVLEFGIGLNRAADPEELASQIYTGKFGIPTTKATRTKDPRLSAIEKDMRFGGAGPEAKQMMDDFDVRKAQAIQAAGLSKPVDDATRIMREKGIPGDPYVEGVGSMLAPHRTATSPKELAPANLGQGIQHGLNKAREAGDDLINQAWDEVPDLFAGPQALEELGPSIGKGLGDLPIDDVLTPAAKRMKDDLISYSSGAQTVDDFFGAESARTVDTQRRRLLAIKNGAQNNSDRAATNKIYGAFESWIDDMADKGFMAGDPAGAAKMRTARAITREVKGLFEPKKGGRLTQEGKILDKVIENDFNPDSIVGTLLGRAGPSTPPQDGAVKALLQIKKALFSPVPSAPGKAALVSREQGLRTWNDIRMAHWSRLIIDKKGGMRTPQMVADNVDQAFRNQQGFMRALYSDEEMKVMKQYVKAVRRSEFKDPNPAGTASTLKALLRSPSKETLKVFLNTQSKRELFSKHNVIMSRIYQMMAANVPNIAVRGNVGARLARRATDQGLTQLPSSPMVGPAGAAIGATSAGGLLGQ